MKERCVATSAPNYIIDYAVFICHKACATGIPKSSLCADYVRRRGRSHPHLCTSAGPLGALARGAGAAWRAGATPPPSPAVIRRRRRQARVLIFWKVRLRRLVQAGRGSRRNSAATGRLAYSDCSMTLAHAAPIRTCRTISSRRSRMTLRSVRDRSICSPVITAFQATPGQSSETIRLRTSRRSHALSSVVNSVAVMSGDRFRLVTRPCGGFSRLRRRRMLSTSHL
jgi:hypothetical protein